MSHIVVIDSGYDSYDYERELFQRNGFTFDVFAGERHDQDGKIRFAQEAVGILLRWTTVDDAFCAALPHLKALVRYGVGYDNVDLSAAGRYQVRVANVQGYANHSVSDHALALLLACSRALPLGQKMLQRQFAAPPAPDVIDLHDKTLGIIGLGRIGSTFCRKARGLFNRVLATDPYLPPEQFNAAGATPCDLATLLRESHAISLHCNLTPETRHILGPAAFREMEQRPIIINTSRGEVVDAAALLTALNEGRLYGAGLDVYRDEPPGPDMEPLLQHPRVVATGHYAWYSISAMVELQKRAAHNMLALLQGNSVADELTRS
jgi:D-3-phosphoglycerate dehydrogenase / 2-oxoglutarate reductase